MHIDIKKGKKNTGGLLECGGWEEGEDQKLPVRYYAYYLGDKIIYTPNPCDT